MKLLRLILLGYVCAFCLPAFCDGDISMDLLPRGRPFRLTFADPREIRMALAFNGDAGIKALIGNYFSIFAVQPKDKSWLLHFGLEGAGFFTMRQADDRFPLETVDGLIGTYVDVSSGPMQYQLRFTHISAHLADGSIGVAPIAYSREFLTARAAFAPSQNYEVYAGVQYLTHSIPVLPPWALEAGGSLFVPWPHTKLTPFTALDLHANNESAATVSVSAQLGIALNNPPEAYHSFRFFYWYYSGQDPRGQFYMRTYTSNSLGIEMQI